MIPFSTLSVYLLMGDIKQPKVRGVIFILVVITFFLKNPILENRNAIGAILFMLFIICMHRCRVHIRVVFSFMIGIFIIFFPLFSILTHSHLRNKILNGEIQVSDIFYQFDSVHFDNWSNLYGAYLMVADQGYVYGANISTSI